MASSLPPPPPSSSSLDPLATTTASPAALKAPKSPLPLFLALSLLLTPYFFLSLHLGLDPRNLPPPLPSLFLVLSTFITLHLLLPRIVVLYAPQTPKGRYGAQWTATNLNVVAGSILWCLVIALKSTNDEKKATDAAVGISVTVVVVMLFVINVGFDTSNENPWNEDDIMRTNLAKEARMEKLKAEMEASKAGGKGGVVEEVRAKEKEVELKKLD